MPSGCAKGVATLTRKIRTSSRTRRDTRAGRVRTAASPRKSPKRTCKLGQSFASGASSSRTRKNPLLRKNNNSTRVHSLRVQSLRCDEQLSYIDDTRASGAGRRQGGASPNAPRPISASPDRNRVISRQNNSCAPAQPEGNVTNNLLILVRDKRHMISVMHECDRGS